MRPARRSPKSDRTAINSLFYLLMLVASVCFAACAESKPHAASEQPIVTAPPAAQTTSPTPILNPTPDEAVALPTPKPAEAQGAVARVYGNAVMVDTGSVPVLIVGDFNGDGSQDIAVVVKPAKGKLDELNSELANWILEDPRQVMQPNAHANAQPLAKVPEPLKVQPNELLMAIIHGYKQEGWRNSEAKQSYLLKNSVGQMMTAQPIRALQNSGNRTKLPGQQNGDIIREMLSGEEGFIYWNGAKYLWHQMTHKPVG